MKMPWLTRDVGLKILSLVLAVAAWIYINDAIYGGYKEDATKLAAYTLVSKQVPIFANVVGTPSEGYVVIRERVTVEPASCFLLGPSATMSSIEYVKTEPISVEGARTDLTASVSLGKVAGLPLAQETLVKVVIPIRRR
ncbi:MAG: YbbR-like domain-containing protein [Candidatus Omnitrophica bacterium]|nr:YbbR-like domain-containing protein [Candidatus Omnitrophota bacterium]